jgi:hypothetical protein
MPYPPYFYFSVTNRYCKKRRLFCRCVALGIAAEARNKRSETECSEDLQRIARPQGTPKNLRETYLPAIPLKSVGVCYAFIICAYQRYKTHVFKF